MIFQANTPRGVLVFFLAITITAMAWNGLTEGPARYFQLFFVMFILAAIFAQFELKIDNGYLIYRILFCKIPIYQRILYPNEIIQLEFKRAGWAAKSAVIHMKKGMNIRIVHFAPNHLFDRLVDFAEENGIAVLKNKDYFMLE